MRGAGQKGRVNQLKGKECCFGIGIPSPTPKTLACKVISFFFPFFFWLREQKKAGAAWSHNFLNLKPWHPANYKNQRLLYIAEKKAEENEKRKKEGEREFNQEQVSLHF